MKIVLAVTQRQQSSNESESHDMLLEILPVNSGDNVLNIERQLSTRRRRLHKESAEHSIS